MNEILKESPEIIEKELYALLNIKKGKEQLGDIFVTKEAHSYFLFQENILTLINNQFSFVFQENKIVINDFIAIYENGNIHIEYSSLGEKDQVGVFFQKNILKNNISSHYLALDNYSDIRPWGIFFTSVFCRKDKVQEYFFNHLTSLATTYEFHMKETFEFIFLLKELFNNLNVLNINPKTFVKENTHYSSQSLYELLKQKNDILSLVSDINFSYELNEIKKYNLSRTEKWNHNEKAI